MDIQGNIKNHEKAEKIIHREFNNEEDGSHYKGYMKHIVNDDGEEVWVQHG